MMLLLISCACQIVLSVAKAPTCTMDGTLFTVFIPDEAPVTFVNSRNTGNMRYTGLVPDLLSKLKSNALLDYTLAIGEIGNTSDSVPDKSTIYTHVIPGQSDYDLNFTFSMPYLTDHLSCASISLQSEVTKWEFLDPFEERLWVAVVITIIVYGAALVSLRWLCTISTPSHQSESCHSFWLGIHDSCAAMFGFLDADRHEYWPIRVMSLGYYLLVLIVVATYTANLAAFLTANNAYQLVPDAKTVQTSKVCSIDDDLTRIFRIAASVVTKTSVSESLQGAAVGDCDAACADSRVLDYYVAKQTTCAVTATPAIQLTPIYRAFSYKEDLIGKSCLNQHITYLFRSGYLENLADQWYGSGGCSSTSTSTSTEPPKISLEAMEGLLIIFGTGVGCAFVATLCHLAYIYLQKPADTSAQTPADTSDSTCIASSDALLQEALRNIHNDIETHLDKYLKGIRCGNNEQLPEVRGVSDVYAKKDEMDTHHGDAPQTALFDGDIGVPHNASTTTRHPMACGPLHEPNQGEQGYEQWCS